jgi:putative ABC transport system substrate-binding protein
MHRTLLNLFLKSWSDNLKSQIQNRQLVGIVAIGVTFAMCAAVADAQEPAKIPRIGYVTGLDRNNPGPNVEAFQRGLQDIGYVEGKNILVEYRYAEGKMDRSPTLVGELVQLNVDLLVTSWLPAIHAAKKATTTIPILIVTTVDPVASGIVNSLARPGGNITVLTTLSRDLSGKRLELLKEVVPRISRIGVVWTPD